MGEEMFNEYRNLVIKSGKKFYLCMIDIFRKKIEEIGEFLEFVLSLIKSVFKIGILKFFIKDKVLVIEEYVIYFFIGYLGIFDGLVIYNGVFCLIEWKIL